MMKSLILFAAVALVAGSKDKRDLFLDTALPYNAPAVAFAAPAAASLGHNIAYSAPASTLAIGDAAAAIAPSRSIAYASPASPPHVAYAAPVAAGLGQNIAYAAPAAVPAVSYAAPGVAIPARSIAYAAPAIAHNIAHVTPAVTAPARGIAFPALASPPFDDGKYFPGKYERSTFV